MGDIPDAMLLKRAAEAAAEASLSRVPPAETASTVTVQETSELAPSRPAANLPAEMKRATVQKKKAVAQAVPLRDLNKQAIMKKPSVVSVTKRPAAAVASVAKTIVKKPAAAPEAATVTKLTRPLVKRPAARR